VLDWFFIFINRYNVKIALKYKMNRLPKILSTILTAVLLPAATNAQSGIFGNTPTGGVAFSMIAESGANGSGGAVAFTPTEDFDFTSVTVWLSGYTGLDLYGNMDQSLFAGIWTSGAAYPGGSQQPLVEIDSLGAPAPNDGSLAPFALANLSPTTLLHAGTEYWLFISENTGGSAAVGPQWVGGNNPVGNAVYDGSEVFQFPMGFAPSSATPAFSINDIYSTPEPGTISFASLSLLLAGLRVLWLRRKTVQ
jgi:hypothetical protein